MREEIFRCLHSYIAIIECIGYRLVQELLKKILPIEVSNVIELVGI